MILSTAYSSISSCVRSSLYRSSYLRLRLNASSRIAFGSASTNSIALSNMGLSFSDSDTSISLRITPKAAAKRSEVQPRRGDAAFSCYVLLIIHR